MRDWPDYPDYDTPDFYRWATHVSRKERKCAHCGATIPAGERYTAEVWKDEKGFQILVHHAYDCLAAMEAAQLAEEREFFSANPVY
jgi:hypothetical protein